MTAATASLDHVRALELAAASPAFTLTGDESRDLAAHLRACADCRRVAARLRSDLAAVGAVDPALSPRLHDRLREVAVTAPRSGPSALGIVLVLALLAMGVVGASLAVGAVAERRGAAPVELLPAEPGDVVAWSTDVVELRATSLSIVAAGRTFSVPAAPRVSSDPGDEHRWTLEVEWQEPGIEQRLFLYFAADETSWWIREVRVYDGAPVGKADWATVPSDFPHLPLGQPFEGDIALRGQGATGPVTLTIGGARIAVRPQRYAMNEPVGGARIRLRENEDVLAVGSPLRCSGILQLPPQAAEARLLSLGYALSWRWDTRTGSNTGYTDIMNRAPATGWINNVIAGGHGELIVFVSNPDKPFGDPLALPPDCPAP